MASREFKESPWDQGRDEKVAYNVTTTPWGSTPSNVAVVLYSIGAGGLLTDVSTTCLSGAASVNGDVITTPLVVDLEAGVEYRLEVMFTTGGNVFEPFGRIMGKL